MDLYKQITENREKQFAILFDPEHCEENMLNKMISLANEAAVDFVFVGGSLLVNDKLDACIHLIKKETSLPVILFPGSEMQVNNRADAILLLSLISGRNPEMLIGKHVVAAPYIRASGLEVLPTGYMLIESGNSTSVLYMSNTRPIPREKNDIAVCTAMAGEMLGLKLIYLDAGSGAAYPVPAGMINKVKENIRIPLIVGGGITSPEIATENCRAGADMIVVGNGIEKDAGLITEIAAAVKAVK
jgi:putative glycerol-1-phosphate prenyltransferase